MPELIKKLFEKSTLEFINHLDINGNERIIFSGRFGTGKTTFLRDYFFTDETKFGVVKRKKDYNTIHIFPVNYSIAQNEDIFRYIKYDILFEMLRQNVDVEHIDLTIFQTLPFFLKDHAVEIALVLLRMVPGVGKDIAESGSQIKKLIDKLLSHYNENARMASKADLLVNYMEQLEKEHGSIYEQDVITRIIENELAKWKKTTNDGGKDKENILIIDDLDRIDPEHIFRILNVFAAHFDRPGKSGNKFGFDKVVVVCDISNVRHIFKARYGQHVDFNGYVDKFYSNSIFHFNPFSELALTAVKLVENVTIVDEYGRADSASRYVGGNLLMKMLFDWLIVHEQIDLRNILKLEGVIIRDRVLSIAGRVLRDDLAKIVWSLIILSLVKGDYLSLVDCFSKSYKWSEKWTLKQTRTVLEAIMDLQASPFISPDSSIESVPFTIDNDLYELKYHNNRPGAFIKWRNNERISQVPIADIGDLLRKQIVETILLLRRVEIL